MGQLAASFVPGLSAVRPLVSILGAVFEAQGVHGVGHGAEKLTRAVGTVQSALGSEVVARSVPAPWAVAGSGMLLHLFATQSTTTGNWTIDAGKIEKTIVDVVAVLNDLGLLPTQSSSGIAAGGAAPTSVSTAIYGPEGSAFSS